VLFGKYRIRILQYSKATSPIYESEFGIVMGFGKNGQLSNAYDMIPVTPKGKKFLLGDFGLNDDV
jgi:hypothetical protein